MHFFWYVESKSFGLAGWLQKLLLLGGYRWPAPYGGRRRHGVNHLARTRITKLLARLALDGLGVVAQLLDLILKLLILRLQRLQFHLQPLVLGLFLLIRHHAVRAEEHMPA